MLSINSDSSSNNKSVKEIKMAYFSKNLDILTVIYSTVPIKYSVILSDSIVTVFSI